MYAPILKPLQLILMACLVLLGSAAFGQKKYDAINFRIDSLVSVGLPASALREVARLEQMARLDHNAPQQVKAAIYRMTFQTCLEQNALEPIISSLRADVEASAYPVKPVLQSVLAGMNVVAAHPQHTAANGRRQELVQTGAEIVALQIGYLKVHLAEAVRAVAHHLDAFGVCHVAYLFHGHYLSHPIDHVRNVDEFGFGCNGVRIGFFYLFVVLDGEVEADLLVHNALAQGPLVVGLYHVRVILFGANHFVAGLQGNAVDH